MSKTTEKVEVKSGEQPVGGLGVIVWSERYSQLIDSDRGVVHRMLASAVERELLRVWWRYGASAEGPSLVWVQRILGRGGLSARGVAANEFMLQGSLGWSWRALTAAVELAYSQRRSRSKSSR